MNRKIKFRHTAAVAMLLAASCIFSVVTAAAASNTTSIPSENVPPSSTLAAGDTIVFPDVQVNDWFYEDVTRLTSKKILNGYPDGQFHPEREITNAEFVKILMISIDADVSEPLDLMLFPNHWASAYISYAYKMGIITDEDFIKGFDPSAPITRSVMTRMMILALGIEPAQIDDPFTDVSDVYAATAYKEYLLRGYLLDDGTRIYEGDGNALRSEAAAIIVRVLDYRADAYAYKRDAILENAEQAPLNTEAELLDLFYVLNREFMTEFTFRTNIPYETWAAYYRHANVIHLEHFYSSYLHCSYIEGSNTYSVTLEYRTDVELLKRYHNEALTMAQAANESIITEGMSDFDKVKAIHDYLLLNCAYDYDNYLNGAIPFESRLAYGALCAKRAVCQGYTAAFNLMCKEAGIRSVVVTGTSPTSPDNHAWNMVLIDGEIYYVDTTHDDPVPDREGRLSHKYFMLTGAQMTSFGYVWDKTHSDIKYFY